MPLCQVLIRLLHQADTRTNMNRFPKCSTRGFSSWIREWICSREQKCNAVESSSVWFWNSQSWSLPLALPWAAHASGRVSQESLEETLLLYGISCRALCEARMWVCDETLPWLAEGHRGDFSCCMKTTEFSVPSNWKTALAKTRQNLLLCITLQGTVMQISCKGAVTSDKLDFTWMF